MTVGELHNEIVAALDAASFKPGNGWTLTAAHGYLSAEHANGMGKASVARMDVDSWPGRDAGHNARLVALLWNNAAMILEALRRSDDTAEIVLPCATCGGKGEVVREWVGGGGAVSPCPTCCKPAEVAK